jgi:CBS domain-containing protein
MEEEAYNPNLIRIGDVMTGNVELTTADATLEVVAAKMRDSGIGMIPVGENDRLVGVLTDRDITVRSTAKGLDPKKTRVREVMTPQVLYCFDDQSVAEAAHRMEQKAVRRLIVLNRERRMVGIISLDDLARLPGEEKRVGEVLEHVTQPPTT